MVYPFACAIINIAYENVEQVVNRMVSHDAIKNFITEDERIVVFSSINGARVHEKFVDLNVVMLTFSIANVGIHIAADNACWPVGYTLVKKLLTTCAYSSTGHKRRRMA